MKHKTTLSALLPLAAIFFSTSVYGQVGINNSDPKATLDVTAKTTDGSKPEGVIAPRLTGDQIQAKDGVNTADQQGAIVYATSAVTTASTKTFNITAPGYYYFDGTIWQKLSQNIIKGIFVITTDNWIQHITLPAAVAPLLTQDSVIIATYADPSGNIISYQLGTITSGEGFDVLFGFDPDSALDPKPSIHYVIYP